MHKDYRSYLCVFVYRLFHEDFFPIVRVNSMYDFPEEWLLQYALMQHPIYVFVNNAILIQQQNNYRTLILDNRNHVVLVYTCQ